MRCTLIIITFAYPPPSGTTPTGQVEVLGDFRDQDLLWEGYPDPDTWLWYGKSRVGRHRFGNCTTAPTWNVRSVLSHNAIGLAVQHMEVVSRQPAQTFSTFVP